MEQLVISLKNRCTAFMELLVITGNIMVNRNKRMKILTSEYFLFMLIILLLYYYIKENNSSEKIYFRRRRNK